MVSVCCGCDGFYPWAGCLCGFVGSLVHLVVSALMKRFRIDDPIDAVAVHGGAGGFEMKGLMATFVNCSTLEATSS